MPRLLGDAFVAISPDAAGFRAKADAQIKAALSGLKYTVPLGVDAEGTLNAIRALRARIAQMGLADFLDVNIPVGKLISQIMVIKRLLNQAGVADILEVNLDKASLAKALATIGNLSETVPVSFDVSKLPVVGPLATMTQKIPVEYDVSKLPVGGPLAPLMDKIDFDISNLVPDLAAAQVMADHMAVDVPVSFDVSKLPVVGAIENVGINVSGAEAATAALAGLTAAEKTAATDGTMLAGVQALLSGPMMAAATDALAAKDALAAQASAEASAAALAKILSGDLLDLAASQQAASLAAGDQALAQHDAATAISDTLMDTAILRNAIIDVTTSVEANNKSLGDEIPLLTTSVTALGGLAGWFGQGALKVQLFGGALTAIGIPKMLATASATHIAADSLIEFAAVVIPASVAFAAFGALAVPTAQHIYVQLQNVWTAANALNTSVGPLKTSMFNLDSAIKPEVYQLFGQALVVATKNTGTFTTIAAQAGTVIDQLGARAAVALTSGGFGAFIKEGPADLAKIGDIIGNIFGTIGNLLHTLPGYAQVLLTAIDDVSKAIESLTGSQLGEWIAEAFLYFHGFILWAGLTVTAVLALGNALVALGAKFGLASAGAKVFDVSQFIGGIETLAGGVLLLGKNLITFAAGEDIAASASIAFDGAMAALDAISPFGWALIAVTAITALVLWLTRATSATDAYGKAAQSAIANAPVTQGTANIIAYQTQAQERLTDATAAYNQAAAPFQAMLDAGGRSAEAATQRLSGYASAVASARADVQQSNQDFSNYSAVLKAAGNSTQVLSDSGITMNQILGASGEQLKILELEAAATAAQENAFATSTGRVGAVMNALNYSGDTTQNMLGSLDVDLQKVVTGMDSMTGVILGGEQSFLSFQDAITGASAKLNTPPGLANAAAVAGATIGGLNAQSQALANSFYNDSIPAFQKLVDSVTLQDISTKNLTTVVATAAGQMTPYIGSNVEARSVIVAMINDALGPGTVSLQNLNTWIKTNSTTLGGFNAIIAQSTIKAGQLANVLQNNLNTMLAQAAADALGGQKALDSFASGVLNGDSASQLLANDGGAKVITMFEQMYQNNIPNAQKAFIDWAENGLGLSQTAALNLWDQLVTLQDNLNTQTTRTVPDTQAAFEAWANSGLDYSTSKADDLWTEITQRLGPKLQDLSEYAGTTGEQNFIKWAENGLDLSRSAAINLYNELNTLQGRINSMHGTSININISGSGSGGIGVQSAYLTGGQGNVKFVGLAGGGKIMAGTGPTSDDVLALVSKGETVVSAADSKKLAKTFKAMGIPGYAGGGLVGLDNVTSKETPAAQYADQATAGAAQAAVVAAASAAIAKAKAAIAAAQKAATSASAGSYPAGVITVAQYILSHGGTKEAGAGVGGVVAGESGGNPEIYQYPNDPNAGGGGILQWTPPGSAFPIQPIITGNVARDMGVQLVDMMAYIAGRGGIGAINAGGAAGGPIGAAQVMSEMEAPAVAGSDIDAGVVNSLWAAGYDKGGWLKPGWTAAYNGTGRPEWVSPPSQSGGGVITLEITGSSGNGTFDAFLTQWLKNNVRVKGGGSVQRAFGRPQALGGM